MLWQLIKRLVKYIKFVEIRFAGIDFAEVLYNKTIFVAYIILSKVITEFSVVPPACFSFCNYILQNSRYSLLRMHDIILSFCPRTDVYRHSTFNLNYIFYRICIYIRVIILLDSSLRVFQLPINSSKLTANGQ